MKRRAFCASAVATLGAAALPFGRAFTAVGPCGNDVEAITADGKHILLPRADVADLSDSLHGQLLRRESAGYKQARKIFNGMFDKRPALIARCEGAADIVEAVKFARAHELLVAVRGGGHSLSGQSVCDDGLMIDLSLMRAVRVDAAGRRVRAGGGALLGDVDRATLPFNLATTTGTVSHTGVAGLTLGGGFGRLARRFGMACDQLESVQIVMADGRLLRASADENADLFWGVRGGGGNFGIVADFEYRLHPFDGNAIGGQLVYPLDQARVVLRDFAELYERAPDGLWIEPILTRTPAGERVLILDFCHTDPKDHAETSVAPYRRLGRPLSDSIVPMRYVQIQTQDDERARIGGHYYTKGGFIKKLNPDLIDAIVETLAGATIPRLRVALTPKRGAIARVPRDATAFWYRDVLYNVLLQTSGDVAAEDRVIVSWVKEKWPALQKFTEGFYSNTYLSETAIERVNEAYGGNFERLQSLKQKYDPTNLFRLNANIRPRV